ncbi:hypothetical protein ACPOL_6801 (plasmid) [Acidisarcina polymorpha]|uniref:Uncharacterized protein n=1 Tax=Acidisarcina polymorpha TaxID=2211140 RepID=A0A2Z5GA41_9BACT|nr:hypothetical protein ACPOL_6801 [Acidisarcina polymorpha]
MAMAHDALDRIRSEVFDLIVLSMMGSEDELGAICRAAAETTGVLRTSDFTGPEELLRKIGELLNKGCRDSRLNLNECGQN